MADAVALKLPTLWTDNIDAWFTQADSQFAIRDIKTGVIKYHYVVSSLDPTTAKRLNVFLTQPLTQTPYMDIQWQLRAKFERTPFERAAAINTMTSLSDWKPSELMDHLLSLFSDHQPDLMFRFHFFNACLITFVPHSPTRQPLMSSSWRRKPIAFL
jgi:hypothetical protein